MTFPQLVRSLENFVKIRSPLPLLQLLKRCPYRKSILYATFVEASRLVKGAGLDRH